MSYVWDGFPGADSELLAMLAMADWCDDKGGSLYPSMKAVGNKIRLGEKQARRIIKSLERKGFLKVIGNAHGGAPGATKQFRLNVERLKAMAEKTSLFPPVHVTPPSDGSGSPPIEGGDPSHPADEPPPSHGSQTAIETPIRTTNKNTVCELDSIELPNWINQKHWDVWHSCDSRNKVTNAQKQLAIEKLDQWRKEGLDHAGALENAAVAGWKGLFKPEARKPAANNGNTHKFAGAAAAIWGNANPKEGAIDV